MVQTIHKESASSDEQVDTKVGDPQDPPNTAESPEAPKTSQSSQRTLKTQMAGLLESTKTHGQPSLMEFVNFLNRTRRLWFMLAAAILGLIAVVTLLSRLSAWARNARERRHEQALASVTPERLLARCGPPVDDVTKDVYPILMRTISYQPHSGEKLLFAFSRTAEEQSDWVFLSMKDESGARSYDTPEAKIAAFPCLDSRK